MLLTAYSTPEADADARVPSCENRRKPQPLAALEQVVYGLLAETASDHDAEPSDENERER